jgi:hypothetical protein
MQGCGRAMLSPPKLGTGLKYPRILRCIQSLRFIFMNGIDAVAGIRAVIPAVLREPAAMDCSPVE